MRDSRFVHAVYFTLKHSSPATRDALVSGCRSHLADHEGTVHFSVGTRADAYARPVNDQDFDVALILVFETEADHDKYQKSPRHEQFRVEQAGNWARVRVFDAFA